MFASKVVLTCFSFLSSSFLLNLHFPSFLLLPNLCVYYLFCLLEMLRLLFSYLLYSSSSPSCTCLPVLDFQFLIFFLQILPYHSHLSRFQQMFQMTHSSRRHQPKDVITALHLAYFFSIFLGYTSLSN